MSMLSAIWPGALLGIYPLLLLASRNAIGRGFIENLALAAAGSVATAMLVWLLVGRSTSDQPKRSLVVALASVVMFYPGVLRASGVDALRYANPIAFLGLWIALSGIVALLLLRANSLAIAATFVRTFAVILVAGPTITLTRTAMAAPAATKESVRPIIAGDSALPSIYLIITDKYTSSAALRESYGFDNSEVQEQLRQLGFVLPGSVHPNYVHTYLSLASLLNWSYLDSLATAYGTSTKHREPAFRMIHRNRLVSAARARGYRVTFLSSPYAPVKMPESDERVDLTRNDLSLAHLWWRSTIASLVWDVRCGAPACSPLGPMPFEGDSPSVVLQKIDTIAALAARPGANLVIAHLLLPHEPYIFEADCAPRTPYWPTADTGMAAARWRPAYLAQIKCTNRLVVSLVSRIIKHSPRPPVILVQGDHGHGGIMLNKLLGLALPLNQLSGAAIRDRASVFGAYYLPGMPPAAIGDSFTLVNLLPRVLNHYWRDSLPQQTDRVYWSEFGRSYHFVPVRIPSVSSRAPGPRLGSGAIP